MANALYADAKPLIFDVIEPDHMPDLEKDILITHINISYKIKLLSKYGDYIIEGIYNRKRNQKRCLTNKKLRKLVRVIRKLAKYEMIRSFMEGLLFDQIESIGDGTFLLNHCSEPLNLTHVYFGTYLWINNKHDNFIFDNCEEVTSLDYLKILFYINYAIDLFTEIKKFVKKDASCWKKNILRNIKLVQKHLKNIQDIFLIG